MDDLQSTCGEGGVWTPTLESQSIPPVSPVSTGKSIPDFAYAWRGPCYVNPRFTSVSHLGYLVILLLMTRPSSLDHVFLLLNARGKTPVLTPESYPCSTPYWPSPSDAACTRHRLKFGSLDGACRWLQTTIEYNVLFLARVTLLACALKPFGFSRRIVRVFSRPRRSCLAKSGAHHQTTDLRNATTEQNYIHDDGSGKMSARWRFGVILTNCNIHAIRLPGDVVQHGQGTRRMRPQQSRNLRSTRRRNCFLFWLRIFKSKMRRSN